MSATEAAGHQPQTHDAPTPAEEQKTQTRRDTEIRPSPETGTQRGRVRDFALSLGRTVATFAIFAVALLAATIIWKYYVTAPWTRDGRVRVQVASITPQVSGQITEVHISDNQYVHKGDVLYVIDPFDFQIALDTARTQQRTRAADLQVKRTEAERRQKLTELATTPEEQQAYVGSETQARAAFQATQVQVAQAEINLARTRVTSPVNGYVTNLLMRVGDYARESIVNVSVIDADSYWIDGYFEETKMANVCIGDRAEAQLLGYRDPILGRVVSVTRGISVSDATSSTQGLPNVDPVYTWVRLAQRVPVRIAITDVPPGVPLVSGLTATVTLKKNDRSRTLSERLTQAWSDATSVFSPPPASPDCIPIVSNQGGPVATLSTPHPTPPESPGEINPGLTPGLSTSPRRQ